jgi:hypothetical protein
MRILLPVPLKPAEISYKIHFSPRLRYSNWSNVTGDTVFKREYMEDLMNVFSQEDDAGPMKGFTIGMVSMLGLDVVNGVRKITLIKGFRQQRAETPDWKYYLTTGCATGGVYESSDIRDFIYALHALCLLTNENFPIDYTEPAPDLARRGAKFVLQNSTNNMFMHAAAGIKADYSTPESPHSSWGFQLGSPLKVFAEDSKWILAGYELAYKAGGEEISRFTACSEPGHVHCIQAKVCMTDTIIAVSEPMVCLDLDDNRFPCIWKMKFCHGKGWVPHAQVVTTWLERAVLPLIRQLPQYKDADIWSEVLWKTFTHDRESTTLSRLPETFMSKMKGLIQTWVTMRDAYKILGYDPDSYEDYGELLEYTMGWFNFNNVSEKYEEHSEETVQKVKDMIKEVEVYLNSAITFDTFGWARMLGERVCITSGGRVAAVNEMSRPGDEIMVFDGCNMPFSVRQEGESYRLIASAYVNGIMYGEAREGDVEWTDVHIV